MHLLLPMSENNQLVQSMMYRLQNLESDNRRAVITDVRHVDEAEFIKKRGGMLVRIVRESAPKLPENEQKHSSVSAIDKIPSELMDVIIDNDGTIDDLERKIESDLVCFFEGGMRK